MRFVNSVIEAFGGVENVQKVAVLLMRFLIFSFWALRDSREAVQPVAVLLMRFLFREGLVFGRTVKRRLPFSL